MNVLLISLGCDKNRIDAERMLGALNGDGIRFTNDESEADAVIVNTCCFINDAKKESIGEILAAAEWRREGRIRALIVTGCLAQRYSREIRAEIPEVDAVVGPTKETEIRRILLEAAGGCASDAVGDATWNFADRRALAKRILTTDGSYAYLKIAEGCDKNCTYCVIPSIRGHYRSVPMDALVEEAEELASGGVRELILIAQETTLYGSDLYGEKKLHELLEKLAAVEGIRWIRLMYCYPEEIYPELLAVMARERKICRYLDLPVQHASDGILRKMNRRTRESELREKIAEIRKSVPGITLRTTLLSGFPQETEEDHEILKRFVRDMRFDRLGVFSYSREEGTPAAEMKGQIHIGTKRHRRRELMELQQRISASLTAEKVGSVIDVMITGYLPEDGVYAGRSEGDAPDIDSYVFVKTDRELNTGDFVSVHITGASEYDLEGVPEDEFTE